MFWKGMDGYSSFSEVIMSYFSCSDYDYPHWLWQNPSKIHWIAKISKIHDFVNLEKKNRGFQQISVNSFSAVIQRILLILCVLKRYGWVFFIFRSCNVVFFLQRLWLSALTMAKTTELSKFWISHKCWSKIGISRKNRACTVNFS